VIFLVLVCIATAALLAWLVVDFGRIALGDHWYPRALLHGVIGVVRGPGERLREVRARVDADPKPAPPADRQKPVAGQTADVWAEPWEVDETVERMVRERLYGNGSSRRHRVDAA
jgi:hypothetical protein